MIGGPEIARFVKNFNNEQHAGMSQLHEDADDLENEFRTITIISLSNY